MKVLSQVIALFHICGSRSLKTLKSNIGALPQVILTEHLFFQIVEFISVLVTVGGEAAEKKLIDLGAVQIIIHLFFE